MDIPESMKEELGAWNNGQGIDLESWVGCAGNFSLAVGYTTIFCPQFIEFEDYIFRSDEPVCEQFEKNIRGFESKEGSTAFSVEWVINHLHIADLQYRGCEDISPDKLTLLGNALKEIYEARLAHLFPKKPCVVKFYVPEDPEDYDEYQLSFWQKKHEQENA
jgi:hypothetical protein